MENIRTRIKMKLKTKPITKNILSSIPYSFKRELSGYIDKKGIHYSNGTKINCPTFPDKNTVFHTHVDLQPTNYAITLPDMPSPVDVIVFTVIGNRKMYLKTPRVFITLRKTKQTDQITDKVLSCIIEHDNYWKKCVRESKNDEMFRLLLKYLKKKINKRNMVWNLSWKRVIEQIFKIKVNIQTSDVKDRL